MTKATYVSNRFKVTFSQLKGVSLVVAILIFAGCFKRNSADDTWLQYISLANDKAKVGDYLGAEELYLKAKEECETSFGDNDARTGTCLGYLAELYRGEQEYVKAAVTYKSLIEIERRCAPNSAELKRDLKEYEHVQDKLMEYGLEEPAIHPQAKKKDALKQETNPH